MSNLDYYMPLVVGLTPPEVRHHYNAHEKLPCHDFVLRPFLKTCECAYVYGLRKDSPLYIGNKDILINDKGKYRFNTEKECINTHEELWNSTGWKRGSIVFIFNNEAFDYKCIFSHCYAPGITATPNTGNTKSATKKCKEAANLNMTALILPASNGVEWVQIYSSEEKTKEYYKSAKLLCQNPNHYS